MKKANQGAAPVTGMFKFQTTKEQLPHHLELLNIWFNQSVVPLTFTGKKVRGDRFFAVVAELKKLRNDNPVTKAKAAISKMSPDEIQAIIAQLQAVVPQEAPKAAPRKAAKKAAPRKPKAAKVETPAPAAE